MSRTTRRMLAMVVLGSALLGGLAVISRRLPYQGFQGETFVRFERGANTLAIARSLRLAGVIRYEWQFWLERAFQPSAKLQAGEYRFAEPASILTVFSRLSRGDVFYFEVKIPEGSNIFDIGRLVEATGAMAADEFTRAAADPALIRDLAPQARSLEGYLYPATYRLSHSTTAAELCQMMTAQFRRQWKKMAPDRSDSNRVVTLASMVEKETGIPEERPVVASVF